MLSPDARQLFALSPHYYIHPILSQNPDNANKKFFDRS